MPSQTSSAPRPPGFPQYQWYYKVCSQPEIANIIRRIDYIDCPAIAAIAGEACLLEPEERATLAEAGLALIHEWVRPELDDLHDLIESIYCPPGRSPMVD
jgi:hypothetical protein